MSLWLFLCCCLIVLCVGVGVELPKVESLEVYVMGSSLCCEFVVNNVAKLGSLVVSFIVVSFELCC